MHSALHAIRILFCTVNYWVIIVLLRERQYCRLATRPMDKAAVEVNLFCETREQPDWVKRSLADKKTHGGVQVMRLLNTVVVGVQEARPPSKTSSGNMHAHGFVQNAHKFAHTVDVRSSDDGSYVSKTIFAARDSDGSLKSKTLCFAFDGGAKTTMPPNISGVLDTAAEARTRLGRLPV
jgi:hypothetical protein